MRAVANSPKFAKKVGVPQSVGKEFEMKDMKKDKKAAKGGMPKALAAHAAKPAREAHAGLKAGGKAKKYAAGGLAAGHKSADGIAVKGKTRGMEPKMAKGGKC